MSSLGSQWRLIRHYLSVSNLNAELEKLIQKIKPVTPEQWDNLINRFEKAVSVRLLQGIKQIEQTENKDQYVVKSTTVEETKPVTKDSTEKNEEKKEEKVDDGLTVGSEAKEITFEGLWRGLKLKKDLTLGKMSEPSWKSNKPIITKTSIHSRTAYVIAAIEDAVAEPSLLRRAQHFVDHLQQYPEARDYAIKEGAVRALLRVQDRLSDEPVGRELGGIVAEALALLGYVEPPRGPGPNILSLDGGGIRGLIAIDLLRELETLTGRRVHELFDFIIGVSTGAIIASVIGSGVGNLDTASEMYHTLSKKMFGNTSVIGGTSRLVWSHSYYDTRAFEELLQQHLGERTLSQCNRYNTPKMALVSCVVGGGGPGGAGGEGRLSPFVFRSYASAFRARPAYPGTARARLWHAVRASAAAPTYFEEFRLDGLLHQDGGLMANNPAAVGVHEARLLYGPAAARRATLVSVGTGRPPRVARARALANTSWRDKFDTILDSATDTEGVHQVLSDVLPDGAYFRLNPPLLQPCAMDETEPARLAALRADAAAYARRNRHKLERVAAALTRPRPPLQRALDAAARRARLLGLAPAD
ncbi:calcium-independent phospholipase A2-gamma-like [Galleria mellonella]|uniref:Calcium-independent phospholipase A2-gamma-like n=1 Tax=Galleria mellonella TaxID=7137 RepID=A0ABM3MVR5_GALME|nr:calcium-independent phospholipase A2-gamma-like [Galleria mellonella]